MTPAHRAIAHLLAEYRAECARRRGAPTLRMLRAFDAALDAVQESTTTELGAMRQRVLVAIGLSAPAEDPDRLDAHPLASSQAPAGADAVPGRTP